MDSQGCLVKSDGTKKPTGRKEGKKNVYCIGRYEKGLPLNAGKWFYYKPR